MYVDPIKNPLNNKKLFQGIYIDNQYKFKDLNIKEMNDILCRITCQLDVLNDLIYQLVITNQNKFTDSTEEKE